MTVLKKEVIDFVFEYFENNDIYEDKEDLIYAGKISEEEYNTQVVFEEFVFNLLPICAKLKKCYSDEEDFFENYTMYIKYNNIILKIYVLYGQGNYFNLTKQSNKENFNADLLLDLNNFNII